jgi:site-specific DNA-methyltransferase (adenine-specific)
LRKQGKFNFPSGELIYGDCLIELKKITSGSVNMIFADPPYFLSNGGISCSSGKVVCVDKGDWDKEGDSQKVKDFTITWIRECKRILDTNGTIWISGTFHNIFEIGTILKDYNFKILNMVTWVKTDPAPNLSGRMFTHSSEFVIWAKKGPFSRQTFNLNIMKIMNKGKIMTDVWNLPHVTLKEKEFGYHPTQKPLHLIERIMLSSTKENDLVLDPFLGSGTTAIAAIKNKRRFIGIENNEKFIEISGNRIYFFSKLYSQNSHE